MDDAAGAVMLVDLDTLHRIAARRRFAQRTLELATRLLVYGDTPKRLSMEFGVNIQRVYAIRREVLEAAKGAALPPGWVEATIVGPAAVVERLERELARSVALMTTQTGRQPIVGQLGENRSCPQMET